jgi:AraC-like DNA-binding protein
LAANLRRGIQVIMHCRPTISEIRVALETGITCRRLTDEDIATSLCCSVRTLHRRLSQHDTTFTAERRNVQAEGALRLLQAGASVRRVADTVSLTPDHLRVVVREAYQMTPSEIERIVWLAKQLRRDPSTLQALADFRRADAALQEALAPIRPSHPLLGWARSIVLLGDRPEFRTSEFIATLRANEMRARRRQRDEGDAKRAGHRDPYARELTQDDVAALLRRKQELATEMRERNATRARARRRSNARTK